MTTFGTCLPSGRFGISFLEFNFFYSSDLVSVASASGVASTSTAAST
jgi:hypothetical protein